MKHTRLVPVTIALATLFLPCRASAAEAKSYVQELNLDFEAADQPQGWFTGGEGYAVSVDKSVQHAGKRSLRIAFEKSGRFGVATGTFPTADARGKRLRLIGYLKAENITTGWAGLWMRVDGPDGVLGFDNMQKRGVTGTKDWARYEIVLDVPEEATNINFGALLTGDGTVWVDTLSFEYAESAKPPPTVVVKGVVKDPEGNPVAGAHVAVVGPMSGRAAGRGRSAAGGRFAIKVPAGKYAITATARGFAAAFNQPSRLGPEETAHDQVVTLGRDGFLLAGRVSDDAGRPVVGVAVRFYRLSGDEGDIFYTETDDKGRYSVKLIPGDGYTVTLESKDHIASPQDARSGADQTVNLEVVRRGPAPDDVVAWVKRRAIALKTPEAEQGFEDMRPLRKIVGKARVVALGEATHGTREFFQLKHRILEFLVETMGFTVFAIEANWPESLAINDYVLHGKGNAKEALAGIYFWTWNTEEVLELIEWMRRYNADRKHKRKIKFCGFDMQTTIVAAREALAYLDKVDPEYAKTVDSLLDPLKSPQAGDAYKAMPQEARTALGDGIDKMLERLDARRRRYVSSSSERGWVLGRQHAVILRQAVKMFAGEGRGFGARDEAMAANIEWILETEPPGTRVVAWAHNGHVSHDRQSGAAPMGSHLAESLGDKYVVFGFAFNQGSFQAIDWTRGRGKGRGLCEHTVGPAPPENLGALFARSGIPIFVLDLRKIPERGTLAKWLGAPRPMRSIGAVFSGEENMSYPIVLGQHFDAMVFVDKTTRARPVKRERTPPGAGR